MTMTRPWRRMIRHLLQIFLTLGLTFTATLLWPAWRAGYLLADSRQDALTCTGRRFDRGSGHTG
jgi:hypothetical protein